MSQDRVRTEALRRAPRVAARTARLIERREDPRGRDRTWTGA